MTVVCNQLISNVNPKKSIKKVSMKFKEQSLIVYLKKS